LRAEVAELADAPDSKSGGAHAPCGFDSHLRHSSAFLASTALSRLPQFCRDERARTVKMAR
jgi:hypothetical protein